MKCQMAYSRKVQAAQYEPLGLSHSIEYNSDDMSDDEAYEYLKAFVDSKLQASLDAMGVRRVLL